MIKSSELDRIAFVGGRIDDGVTEFPPRVIPYGDRIIESFTISKISYYRTQTGYFLKKRQSMEIERIRKGRFDFCRSLHDTALILSNTGGHHTAFRRVKMCYPRAGLTRGSNASFSILKPCQKPQGYSSETKMDALLPDFDRIQKKYKDGVK